MIISMKRRISILVVALVIAGGIFFGGMKYGQAQTQTGRNGNQFMRGQAGAGAMFGGRGAQGGTMRLNGGVVAGEILSKDATSITVKLPDGGSKIVFTSASTTVQKTTE